MLLTILLIRSFRRVGKIVWRLLIVGPYQKKVKEVIRVSPLINNISLKKVILEGLYKKWHWKIIS